MAPHDATDDPTDDAGSGDEWTGDDGWLSPERADERTAEQDVRHVSTEDDVEPAARMRRAVEVIRREGHKVTVIYATIDAALAVLTVNLLVGAVGAGLLPATLPWPRVLHEAVIPYTGVLPPVPTSIVAGLAAGIVVLVAESVVRTQRPTVEQFEAANPDVREALRTARDVVQSGGESRMAVALYEDVLTRLRCTSSLGLVNLRRVFATVALVSVVSLANVHVAVVGLQVADVGTDRPEADVDTDPDGGTTEYEGLQDPSGVLGEPEDVTAGEETFDATVSTGGGADSGMAPAVAYDAGGFSDETEIEAQDAGFADRERLDDAELVREYNLRIRSEDDNT